MKLILRNLFRNKGFAFINLFGLSLGFASCMLIILFIQHELNYDTHHENHDQIFRVTTDIKTDGDIQRLALCPMRLNSILKNEYPEIEEVAYVCELADRGTIFYGNKHFNQDGIREASPELFNVFTYPIIIGNPATALNQPNSIMLTKTLALKIFGKLDVINQTIMLGNGENIVTAVIQDVPKNSEIQFKALTSSPYIGDEDLLDFEGLSFIKVKKGTENKLPEILNDIVDRYYRPMYNGDMQDTEIIFHAQPLTAIHFSEELLADSPQRQ